MRHDVTPLAFKSYNISIFFHLSKKFCGWKIVAWRTMKSVVWWLYTTNQLILLPTLIIMVLHSWLFRTTAIIEKEIDGCLLASFQQVHHWSVMGIPLLPLKCRPLYTKYVADELSMIMISPISRSFYPGGQRKQNNRNDYVWERGKVSSIKYALVDQSRQCHSVAIDRFVGSDCRYNY